MKTLSARLRAITDLVIPGQVVADVGTDHAYLPIYLIVNDISPRAIGIEINPGPLKSAAEQVAAANLNHRITIRKENGLHGIQPGEAQAAVVAGMGGKTICDILEDSPEVLASLNRLILQPMGAVRQLREWLLRHFWQIQREDLVLEDGIFYNILMAEPGNKADFESIKVPAELAAESFGQLERELEFEVGPDLIRQRHPLLPEYLEFLIEREVKVLQQLERTKDPVVAVKRQRYRERINGLKQLLARIKE